jgi:AAA ATPase domain
LTSLTESRNPYRPGAGHMPPHLAGREREQREFDRLLDQPVILENVVLTGLRGVGKTVLLETLKPIAVNRGWLWVGTDLSESASATEANLAIRLLADLSVVTSMVAVGKRMPTGFGEQSAPLQQTLDYQALAAIYDGTPGLLEDKLKVLLEHAWRRLQPHGHRGLIFAYDEAQNLSDNAARDQFPLSVLLDVFQSLQRKDLPLMLVLSGLPTLFPKLVQARTFAERMFHVITLGKLEPAESHQAIDKPLNDMKPPSQVRFTKNSIDLIVKESGGYPYFIQFICREAFDVYLQQLQAGETPPGVPMDAITRKLDTDFFAGRWSRATDRQRELLWVISQLPNSDGEFTVQEIVNRSAGLLHKPFGGSNVNQMLAVLCEHDLIYKNRHGRYSFAIPLLDQFVQRQFEPDVFAPKET